MAIGGNSEDLLREGWLSRRSGLEIRTAGGGGILVSPIQRIHFLAFSDTTPGGPLPNDILNTKHMSTVEAKTKT